MQSLKKAASKKEWTLSPDAFDTFLVWLDEGTPSDGQKYLEMRERLVAYFDRKNCLNPDELADETLNRVARRLEEEEGTIECESPAKYCYIVARFVFMESLRQKPRVPIDDVLANPKAVNLLAAKAIDDTEIKEKRFECLENCTNQLESASREIIIRYYYGQERIKIENRRLLAENLQVSPNALAIRACRIRDKLEICVRKCVG